MSLDRKVMEATAIKHGAEIVNKLEDTNWIVLGTRPGAKKVQEIKEKDLNTMSEDQFFEMVKGGGEPTESAGVEGFAEPPKKKAKT
jgi:BRCT domain type II-containing protein